MMTRLWGLRSAVSDSVSADAFTPPIPIAAGMARQDLAGTPRVADFDWFEYCERPYVVDVSQLELV